MFSSDEIIIQNPSPSLLVVIVCNVIQILNIFNNFYSLSCIINNSRMPQTKTLNFLKFQKFLIPLLKIELIEIFAKFVVNITLFGFSIVFLDYLMLIFQVRFIV